MKVFFWNSRAAGGSSLIAAMKEFRKKHNPEIMVIAETRTSEAPFALSLHLYSSGKKSWWYLALLD